MIRKSVQYEQAKELRKRGFTYAEIAKIVDVSKAPFLFGFHVKRGLSLCRVIIRDERIRKIVSAFPFSIPREVLSIRNHMLKLSVLQSLNLSTTKTVPYL